MIKMPSVVVAKKKPRLKGLALLREEFASWKKRKQREIVNINEKNKK